MGLGGGGGGGILGVGNSFTGAAYALELVGDHCFAYSGLVATAAQDAQVTMLEFTTGNFYTVGQFQFNYERDTGDDMIFRIFLADTQIQGVQLIHGDQPLSEPTNTFPIILTPYTIVKTTVENINSSTARNMICSYTGRIYRG